jgi:uncharacterized membrane protein YuzA (DUF378 family)
MKRTSEVVVWSCILNTLLVGCFSSAMISPTGDEKEKVYTDEIEVVITKDGTKYEFDIPAGVASNAIVGPVNHNRVSVPLSEVEKVQVSSFSYTKTVLLVVGIAATYWFSNYLDF